MWAVPRDALESFPTEKISLSRFSIMPVMTCGARMEIETDLGFGKPKGRNLFALGHHRVVPRGSRRDFCPLQICPRALKGNLGQ